MAENKPSLLVAVKKLRHNFDINHAKTAKISRGFRTLGVLDSNDCLTICDVLKRGGKTLDNVQSFEWGSQTNTTHDHEYPESTADDCLVVIKDDHCVQLYHVQQRATSDDDDSCLVVNCDVVVKADLLKSLLRDRGKDSAVQEVSIIAMETEQDPHTHNATLLINDKYIVVITLNETEEPNMVSCFALNNSMPTLPIVIPVLSLVQVKRCHSLIFCLFSSGTAMIHHISGDFIACVDIQSYHYSKQDPDLEDASSDDASIDVQQFQRKFVHLEVTEDLSLVVSSDDSNNIYTVNLDEYFRDNPDHLNVKDKATRTKTVSSGMQFLVEDEDQLVRNTRMADIACGDRFWKNELLEMRMEAAKETSVTNGIGSYFNSDNCQSNGRWFSNIKDLKLLDYSIKNKTKCTMTKPPKTLQRTGFLLKRKKSESRSITPSSENSYNMNKEPALRKFSWTEAKSLFYQSDKWIEEHQIVKLFAASDSLIVWFRPANKGQQVLGSDCPFGLVCLFGYGIEEALYRHLFSEPILMVDSSDSFQPACLLTKNQLCIPSFGVDQNQLVHKVIMYENAALAESLCHINHWDHCVIPLEALQVALKHRQLDTVAFFLKTQENVFTSSTSLLSPSSSNTTLSPQFLSPSPSSTTQPVTMDIQQTEHVINALVKSVKKNAKQHHNLHFTSQLLQMTLMYLHSLLEDGTRFIEKNKPDTASTINQEMLASPDVTQPAMVSAVEDCLMFVTKSIVELRRYLGNIPEKQELDAVDGREEEIAFDDVDGLSQETFEKWKTMNCKEVIRDAVISGNIGTAQAYFLSNRSHGEISCDGSLSSITTTGLEIMLNSLVNQDVDTAIRIITNLGRDPVEQLHTLCFNTLHRPLRDFLISELDAKGHLTNDEKEMLQFVEALENLYNTQSFEMAKEGLTSQTDSWTDLGLLKNTFNLSSTRVLETNVRTGSLLQGLRYKQRAETCGGYSEVLLEWVQAWNSEACQRILLERMLSDKDTTKSSMTISPQALWHYFASRGDWRTMRSWVRAMALNANPSPDDPVVSIGDALSIHEDVLILPPLTRDVFSQFPACPTVIKDVIVDELTRYGLFTTEELSNFNILLYHLCRTQTLFTDPHPLHGIKTQLQLSHEEQIHDDAGRSAFQIVSLGDFHRTFIEYCIRMQFVNLLYHYLDYYGLGESLEAVLELQLESDKPHWFDMLISFRLAGKHPEDKDSVFRASLSNARIILNNSSPSITAMLNEGCPIMALATLVYGPGPISQAIVSTDRSIDNPTWQVQDTLLRRSLLSYPKLLTALFPVTTSVDGMEPQDITVYQLLQGNSPLEISRMFGWQSTNELALKADMVCEMPHFSLAPLVSQYAYQEQLAYSYYLRHGRPSFAFAAFVGSQLAELCVTRARIFAASKKAYRIAIQHFTDTQITTSCVVFTEMLGIDSTGLRVDIQAANRILSHAGRETLQGTDGRNGQTLKDKIVSELISRGTRQLTTLLSALEEATLNLISKYCLERSSFESSNPWTLVLMFCRVHKMELSTAYLIDCAKADKWLPFVCFAQVGQYPKHQVLGVIENHFTNRHIKEHLCLAFENVQTIQLETTSDELTRKRRRKRQATKKDEPAKVVTPTKDIRAQFYSRMGLKKRGSLGLEVPSCPHSSSAEEDEVKNKPREKKSSDKDSSSATDGTVTAEERPCITSKSTTDMHERQLDPNTLPDNLFNVLFSCESAHVPWRSLLAHSIALHRSLFAVLAACYEESKPLDCICAWLCSTLKPDILDEVTHNIPVVEWHRWSGPDLTGIITAAVKHKERFAVSLAKAFYIFDPKSPMLRFLRFYESFVVHVDFDNCQKELDLFKKSYSKLTMRDSSVSQSSLSITRDVRWIEEVTSLVTQQMVRQCCTSYEQGHLLSLLAKTMFGRNYSFKIPNYYKLHKINEVIQDTKVVADFAQMLDEDSDAWKDEIQRVLQGLLAHKSFSQARDYAELLGLPQDPITLKEVLHERESIEDSVLWEIKQGRLAFWHKADECFKSNRCNPEIAASFFETQAEDNDLSFTEKSRMLSMALQWYSRTVTTGNKEGRQKEELSKLEKRIWLCSIRAEMEKNREVRFARSVSHLEFLPSSSDWAAGVFINRPSDDTLEGSGTNELIQPESFDTSMSTDGTVLTTDEEFSALERVIGELLEGCYVTQARRLAAHFEYTSQDLNIILSCIFLAQATRFVDTLDDPIRKLLNQTPHRRISVSGSGSNLEGIKRSGSFVLSTSLTDSVGHGADDSISVDWVQVEDTITAMESLTYFCKKGKKCCARITTCYKIAQTLGLEYEAVVTNKPFNVLHSLLVSGFDSRYKLADAYIKAFDLSSDEVVGFLKDTILLSLRVYCGEERSKAAATRVNIGGDELSNGENDLIFNAAPSCDDVIQVIRLCSDQALLGNRLLETAASVARDRVSRTGSNKALHLEVELLVRAHECHTIACNMEGITSVLKCGRHLTAALANSEEYRLMVRLLTGIGRFREMSYIFDTLLRHHHFELLCQRGIDKENKLKVALLEYLKRCHPDDDEKYKIVAMHFSMYRELADTWETSAITQMKELKDQQMTAKPELESKLTSIMNSFKYATDYYTKEGCFQHSQKCLKYARLVKLQLHLLPSGIRVINLNEGGLKQFLSEHNHFFEALLVVDAYEKRGSNLWISAIYYHVVVAGDFKYWQDLRSVMTPASVLFVDVANKFKNANNHQSPQVTQNMKKLLTYLPELRVRYRIATDLGFRDVSSAILERDGGAYLRDIMGISSSTL